MALTVIIQLTRLDSMTSEVFAIINDSVILLDRKNSSGGSTGMSVRKFSKVPTNLELENSLNTAMFLVNF